MKIKKWIHDGHDGLSDVGSTEELLERAGDILDSACAYDIAGDISFIGDDGKVYVGSVEFVIGEASPEYAEELLSENS